MACRLIGAKPLPEPMLEYLWLGSMGTNLTESLISSYVFSLKKMQKKCLQMAAFSLGLNELT